jgi:phosphopantothenoylcysteine decarboxylase/phosphopantothenate--cysteine ligase
MDERMSRLTEKRIVLGVTGGIAAYKAAELTRALRAENAEVRVVMTRAATAFIAPLTFQALSGQPVHLDLLDAAAESAMGHITLARWADLILIAPATADFIAKVRAGLADDLLSALCLAAEVPLALAPAMNQAMWANAASQDNVACLKTRGIRLFGPAEGAQACGETGLGRMLEPAEICRAAAALFAPAKLSGVSVLVSAGPTREAIDPVRYLSNRSSGKMGYAVAEAALAAGAAVTLVSGPVALAPVRGAEMIRVESAAQMYDAVLEAAPRHGIYIGAAAVADYTPAAVAGHKIKKHDANLTIPLIRTRDILAQVATLPQHLFTVGFAAETDNLDDYARQKLASKGLDMVAANRVGTGLGFDADDNALRVFWRGGVAEFPTSAKSHIATQLIELIAEHYFAKHPT